MHALWVLAHGISGMSNTMLSLYQLHNQVDAQEMRILHREKSAATESTRRTERIAIQQALELQTAHNTNATLAEVCTPCLLRLFRISAVWRTPVLVRLRLEMS